MSLLVWRIGFSGAPSLADQGYGSTLANGRWHRADAGRHQVIYCGSSRALCQLEKRVHCNGYPAKNMALFQLEIPDDAELKEVTDLGLPTDWKTDQVITQAIGMKWLADNQSVGLWVPSFVESSERNLLLNPAHADFARISFSVEKSPFEFDPRLFG